MATWKARGYSDDIPDEVPAVLMAEGLAPSYKAIAIALLRNEPALESLGFSAPRSQFYDMLKRLEFERKGVKP